MKKLFMAMIFAAGAFTVNAQQSSEAPVEAQPEGKKTERVQPSASQQEISEANAEAQFREMREAVKTLEMQKNAITNDKSLSDEARKEKLQKLQEEHDALNRRIRN